MYTECFRPLSYSSVTPWPLPSPPPLYSSQTLRLLCSHYKNIPTITKRQAPRFFCCIRIIWILSTALRMRMQALLCRFYPDRAAPVLLFSKSKAQKWITSKTAPRVAGVHIIQTSVIELAFEARAVAQKHPSTYGTQQREHARAPHRWEVPKVQQRLLFQNACFYKMYF